ncbi:hypothetical protein F9U64_07760 [Gracilibacillus oryzae]|uniref:Uncharacterized protein n=1 Tax=Gracilibacillus oryzae TaxID=1672701 RepID=A0A7C8GTZ5_9BACI|nr:hypothetical protein [Gracilibacillus oryzae]KAB8137822.1 hypothetical protein F9U64_07760 [Gracilibacillus oryzae]
MGSLIIYLIIIIFAVIVVVNLSNRHTAKENSQITSMARIKDELETNIAPGQFVFQANIEGIDELESKLHRSFTDTYISQIKQKYVDENSENTERHFTWLFYELKRFYFMAAIFKEIPMYNLDIDDIWHKMIMYTRDYQSFCHDFIGDLIHHQPNAADDDGKDPDKRALFEFYYSVLFEVDEKTAFWHNPFYRYRLDDQVRRDFQREGIAFLLEKYFRETDDPLLYKVQTGLIEYIQSNDQIFDEMDRNYTKKKNKKDVAAPADSSGAVIFAGGADNTHDSSDSSGGGDSSSSCGSSCGSGCGGN